MSSYRENNIPDAGNNKAFFSKILKNLSNHGMDIDNLLYRNSHTVGLNEIPVTNGMNSGDLYTIMSRNATAKVLESKAISYIDRSYTEKLRILREYARKDEIRNYITAICDEAILYDESEDFCYPVNLPPDFDEDLRKKYIENFDKVYYNLGFNDGIAAWNYFKKFITEGFIAFEIIYDDKFKEIKNLKSIDPNTLIPAIEPTSGDSIWIQYPDNPEYRKILLDCQIIYISYASGLEYTETSYIEALIRPYNQLKLLEQTRIMFNVANAMINKKFVVPTQGMNQNKAEETLAKLIADYKDEITFNDEMGTISINGSPHIPYSKEYWFPSGEQGTPDVSNLENAGHNLNENDTLIYFYNALKRASKIPFSRFDKDNGGGNVFSDMSDMSRDEQTFFYFIQRLRTIFKEIIVKPWKIQMLLDYPELTNDTNFLRNLDIEFNGSNLFHEWKKLSNISKRAEIAGNLMSQITDAEGNSYFHPEFVVRNFMKLSDDLLAENDSWKKKSDTGTGSVMTDSESFSDSDDVDTDITF